MGLRVMKQLIMSRPKDPPDLPLKSTHRLGEAATDAAFDLWLQRSLHHMFDPIANEPLPRELLDMIEADRLK